ncbi:MAG: hypothetical protein QXY61_04920 [Candidatus Anstonellales archaeon]
MIRINNQGKNREGPEEKRRYFVNPDLLEIDMMLLLARAAKREGRPQDERDYAREAVAACIEKGMYPRVRKISEKFKLGEEEVKEIAEKVFEEIENLDERVKIAVEFKLDEKLKMCWKEIVSIWKSEVMEVITRAQYSWSLEKDLIPTLEGDKFVGLGLSADDIHHDIEKAKIEIAKESIKETFGTLLDDLVIEALTHLKMGKEEVKKAAMELYTELMEKAAKLPARSEDEKWRLARIYLDAAKIAAKWLGDEKLRDELVEKAIELDPTNSEIIEAAKKIQSLTSVAMEFYTKLMEMAAKLPARSEDEKFELARTYLYAAEIAAKWLGDEKLRDEPIEKAIELDPTNSEIIEAAKKIQSLTSTS